MRSYRLILSLVCAVPLWVGDGTASWADDCSKFMEKNYPNGYTYRQEEYYSDALRLCRPLAKQGSAEAQIWMGKFYVGGHGVPKDFKMAQDWFYKAAERGNAKAQVELGLLLAYENGWKDNKAAANWLSKAAEYGNADGQNWIGFMYAHGHGVSEDYVQAYMWFILAASSYPTHRLNTWAEEIDTVAAKMTPSQIAEARALARNWKPMSSGTSVINAPPTVPRPKSVPMTLVGGTFAVPVGINNVITLDFIVDSGAAYVSIPSDVVSTLVRSGTLQASDFIGQETFVLADGSQVPSATFRIRSLKVGDVTLENVVGSVANAKGSLLLGQSFLGRFQSWSIDNASHALLLGEGRP